MSSVIVTGIDLQMCRLSRDAINNHLDSQVAPQGPSYPVWATSYMSTIMGAEIQRYLIIIQ